MAAGTPSLVTHPAKHPFNTRNQMKPNLYALFLALLMIGNADAQIVEWGQQTGTPNSDYRSGVSVDGLDGVYITGSLNFGGGAPSGEATIARYTAEGQLVWQRIFGSPDFDTATAVDSDASGNVVVSGRTDGSLFGTHAGGQDSFVVKYDVDGNLLWAKQFGSAGGDFVWDISLDGSGNVFVVGFTSGDLEGTSHGLNDAFVRKYDPNGNHLWTRQFGTTNLDYGHGLATDAQGNVYVVGRTADSLFGQTYGGWEDAFLVKFDADGNELWGRLFGSAESDSARSVVLDAMGGVLVAGETGGLGFQQDHLQQIMLAKFDTDGTFQWQTELGSSEKEWIQGMKLAPDGTLLVCGLTAGVFGDEHFGGNDAFVCSLDPVGNLLWAHQLGSAESEFAADVDFDSLGQIFLVGPTDGGIFSPNMSQHGGYDNFFARISTATSVTPTGQKVLDGSVVNGAMDDVFMTDDLYLELLPLPTKNPIKQIVDVIFQSELPAGGIVSELNLHVESKVLAPAASNDVVRSIALFNQNTNRFELVDLRAESTDDATIKIVLDGDLSRFVSQANEVTGKITWRSEEFSGSPYSWSVDLDRFAWSVRN